MNKYIYAKRKEPVPYPTDVYKFCEYYRGLREMEKRYTGKHVHRFRFEDFIYKYDETVELVREILGSEDELPNHVLKKKYFNPEKSINNTQLFYNQENYKDESEIIEKLLPEYLYDFPYHREAEEAKMF